MKEKNSRIRWFHYSAEDAKAAQAELEELAREGWELEELGLLSARFRFAEEPRACWVEPARWRGMGRKDTQRREEYLQLCGQAGWDLVDESRGLWYFRARSGERPAPVQTDGAVEWESVWRKALFDRAFNLLFLGVIWTVHFWVRAVRQGHFLWELLLSNCMMAVTAGLQLLLLAEIAYGAYLLCYRRRCRRAAGEGAPLPIPGRWGARLRGSLSLWAGALIAVLLLTLLAGVGEGQPEYLEGSYTGYTCRTSSVCAEHWTYRRFREGGDVWAEVYDCRFSWLAERICRDLAAQEGEGKKLGRDLHFHPPAQPEPVQLGFEEAWTYCAGDRSGLILRQGNKIVRVETQGVDLTNPDILVKLREGLQLGT